MSERLSRSRTDRVFGGVCGGLGKYLGIDPIIIRLAFILLSLGHSLGVLVYFILWVLLPVEGAPETASGTASDRIVEGVKGVGEDFRQIAGTPRPQAGLWIGVGLIIIGAILFIERISEQYGIYFLSWVNLGNLWALLLILLGVAIVARGFRKGE